MKTLLLVSIIIALELVPLSIDVSALCTAESLQWWEPCNDTGEFSDGIHVKYAILIPALIMVILISGIVLLFYRRKKKMKA